MARATEIEKLRRLKAVAQWVSDGYSSTEIIQNIAIKWGLDTRQAKRYISEVKEEWKNELRGEVEELRDIALKRNLDSYTRVKRELDAIYDNINLDTYQRVSMIAALEKRLQAIRQDMSKLQGLYTEKLEHSGQINYKLPERLPADAEVVSDDIE